MTQIEEYVVDSHALFCFRLLTMPNNMLTGTLPSAWGGGGWRRLQIITVYSNNLTGGIPANWSSAGSFPAMTSINNGM